jgi:hypothetical protein
MPGCISPLIRTGRPKSAATENSAWCNCPFFFGRGDQFQARLSHKSNPPIESTVCNLAEVPTVTKLKKRPVLRAGCASYTKGGRHHGLSYESAKAVSSGVILLGNSGLAYVMPR